MDFYELCDYLLKTFELFPEKDIKRVNKLTQRMKTLYPETTESAFKMNKALYSCAVDLILGGMNTKNFYADGKRKDFKSVCTSLKGEPLMYSVVYEDDPGYATARFVLP